MKKVIIVFGPTGIGKTELSIELAKELNGEIISADSMQIYRGMNIGTAKVMEEESKGIKHHMLDIISPDEEYSVGEYVKEVKKIIQEVFDRNKTPIIVGGTGLYINGLIHNYDFAEVGKNKEVREKYAKIAEEKGNNFLYNLLKVQDPIRASQLHPNDVKRIVRALEIIEVSKIAPLENEKNTKNKVNDFEFLIFGLDMDREKLYKRINIRVEKMFADGLVDEVKSLLKSGVKKESQCMQGIGYKEVIDGLENDWTEEEIKELIKQRTRNYAKRQFTFMRGIKGLIFIEAESAKDEILNKIKEVL